MNVDEISGVGLRVDVHIVVDDRVDVGEVVVVVVAVVVCLVQAQTRKMSNDNDRDKIINKEFGFTSINSH